MKLASTLSVAEIEYSTLYANTIRGGWPSRMENNWLFRLPTIMILRTGYV